MKLVSADALWLNAAKTTEDVVCANEGCDGKVTHKARTHNRKKSCTSVQCAYICVEYYAQYTPMYCDWYYESHL